MSNPCLQDCVDMEEVGRNRRWKLWLAGLLALLGLLLLLLRNCGGNQTSDVTPSATPTTAVAVATATTAPVLNLPETLPSLDVIASADPANIVLSGFGEPNSDVELFNNGISLGKAKVGADGRWSFPYNFDGYNNNIEVAGVNGRTPAQQLLFPSLLAGLTMGLPQLGDFSLGADGVPTGSVSLSGEGEPGMKVLIFAGDTPIGETTVNPDGTWAWQGEIAQASGDYDLTARMVSPSDDSELATANGTITIPTVDVEVAAEAPSVDDVVVGDDDNVTYSGKAAPNSQVLIFVDGVQVGETTADADGNWTFSAPGTAGDHVVTAQSADGLVSDETPYTIGEVANTAPTVEAVAVSDDQQAVAYTGTASPNSQVLIFVDGVQVGEATADADGNWSFSGPATAGDHVITAQSADGLVSNEAPYTVGEGEPSAPTVDTATVSDDQLTATYVGKAQPNSKVVVFVDGVQVGEMTADADGNWTFSAPATPGDHIVTAQTPDNGLASNEQPYTVNNIVTIDSAEGGENDGDVVSFKGKATPNSTVQVIINGEPVGTAVADADGNWSFDWPHQEGAYTVTANIVNPNGGDPLATTSTGRDYIVGSNGRVQVVLDSATPNDDGTFSFGTAIAGYPTVHLILDASWSMVRDTLPDGSERIAVAKEALRRIVTDVLPDGVPVAYRAFGHLEGNLACQSDLELPVQTLNRETLLAEIDATQPQFNANTALAESLRESADDLAGVEGKKIIVLLTDGKETCQGDPGAEIQALVDAGIDVEVNIVGLAISEDELREQFKTWAALSGGNYYDAGNADELTEALQETMLLGYRIRNEDGTIVQIGRVGGIARPVPPGTYSVEVLADPLRTIEGVEVERGETTLVRVAE